jgi:drug/metabolite transporter (DMT)-like permease
MESSIINGTMLIWIPILAVIFLGERITKKELIGLALAGIGTLLVHLRRSVILLQLWKRSSV